jgi:hypothetical protein
MKRIAFCTVGLAAMLTTACQDHSDLYDGDYANAVKQLEYSQSFPVQNIDPNQDWNLFTTANVQVAVNEDWGETYTVKVYTANPLDETSGALLLAKGEVKSGDTFSTQVDVPKAQTSVFVALVNSKNQTEVKIAPVASGVAETTFGVTETRATTRTTFVEPTTRTTEYTEAYVANLLTQAEEFTGNQYVEPAIVKISSDATISNQFNGDSDNNPLTGTVIIITNKANVTLTGDAMNGVTVVVQNGTLNLASGAGLGRSQELVILPSGKLTNANGSSNVLTKLYNAGEIDAKGTLQYMETYSTGLINVAGDFIDACWNGANVFINNGHLFVSGDFKGNGEVFYNNCYAKVGKMTNCSGIRLADNAQLIVNGELKWYSDQKLGVNSFLSIGELKDNIGWSGLLQGPETVTSTDENAKIKIKKVSEWNFETRVATGYLTIDCGEIAISGEDNQWSSIGRFKMRLLGYVYSDDQSTYPSAKNVTLTAFDDPETPTEEECGVTVTKSSVDLTETKFYVYYAFEDLGSIGDYDFNDVIVRVSNPDDNGDAKFELVAVGGTLSASLVYGNTTLWADVHGEDAYNTSLCVNVGTDKFNANYPTKTINIGSNKIYDLKDLKLVVTNVSGTNQSLASTTVNAKAETGEAPQCLCIPAGWKWPKEYSNICTVYNTEDFSITEWIEDSSAATGWYLNVAEGYESYVITPEK